MSLDWSHLILRTKYGSKTKVLFEPLHKKHIENDGMMNFEPTHTSITKDEMYCV